MKMKICEIAKVNQIKKQISIPMQQMVQKPNIALWDSNEMQLFVSLSKGSARNLLIIAKVHQKYHNEGKLQLI